MCCQCEGVFDVQEQPHDCKPRDRPAGIKPGLLIFKHPAIPGRASMTLEATAELDGEQFPARQMLCKAVHFVKLPPEPGTWGLEGVEVDGTEQLAVAGPIPMSVYHPERAPQLNIATQKVTGRTTITVVNLSERTRPFGCTMLGRFVP
jgi:hypothetical protein